MSYQLIKSKSGLMSLKYKDQFLHSNYDPKKEAKRFVEGLKLNKKKCFIVLGLGLAYHIEEILSLFPQSKIIVIEKNQSILTQLEQSGKIDLINKIQLAAENVNLKSWLDLNIEEEDSDSLQIIEHPASVKIDDEYYQIVKAYIVEMQKYKLQSFLTSLGFSKRWHENVLGNLKYYFQMINNEKAVQFKSKIDLPVMIVGSGPSLDSEIEIIKKMENRSVIIVLAPAYHRLLKEGIRADFMISVEGGIANRLHLRERDQSQTIFVTSLSVNPHLLRIWQGKILIFNHLLEIENYFLENHPAIPMQGNVALAAFNFAHQMSSGPFIFLGLDFAFTHNLYHYKGNRLEDRLIYQSNRFQSLDKQIYSLLASFQNTEYETFSESKVKSNMAMLSYLKWMEDAILNSKSKYYSFDSYGAKIKSVKLLKEKDIEVRFPIVDKKLKIEKLSNNCINKIKSNISRYLDSLNILEKTLNEKENITLDVFRNIEDKSIYKSTVFALSRLVRKLNKGIIISDYEKDELKSTIIKWQRELRALKN